ncbi:hypothetical protein LTR37_007629 [Vermiconidia calcicola]|uniref:Uncharacterized protein n=1 Tax=Vermiconidia calcicola TaxID=1690605 RepID=A0ACC3NCY8_9PEZI|nr:hypothetical protein LTR37_007629 [Vermiconidia calcicola]
MAAASKVLSTFELVEDILLRSTPFEMIVASAVCQYWREVVEGSKRIRNLLLNSLTPQLRQTWERRPFGANVALDPWLFMTKTGANTRLFVLRIPAQRIEGFILASKKQGSRLRVLDSAYEKTFCTKGDIIPNLSWKDENGKIVCTATCNGHRNPYDALGQYLLVFYSHLYGTQLTQP